MLIAKMEAIACSADTEQQQLPTWWAIIDKLSKIGVWSIVLRAIGP